MKRTREAVSTEEMKYLNALEVDSVDEFFGISQGQQTDGGLGMAHINIGLLRGLVEIVYVPSPLPCFLYKNNLEKDDGEINIVERRAHLQYNRCFKEKNELSESVYQHREHERSEFWRWNNVAEKPTQGVLLPNKPWNINHRYPPIYYSATTAASSLFVNSNSSLALTARKPKKPR